MVHQVLKTLSEKQSKVLTFIQDEISRSGIPPTYRDIGKHFGYEAVGTVQDHIAALIRKGFLRKIEGAARGFQLMNRSEARDIPILGMVPAGSPMEAIAESSGSIPVPDRWRGKPEIFALKVKGESMVGAGIFDGDYVIVKKQLTANHGDIIVAMIDGEVTVKYLENKNGRVRLLPDNPKFKPIEIPPELENCIQGRVVGVQRYWE